MKFSSTLQMLSLLARQISCHICGDEDEIRVISLKPPAAIMRMYPLSLSSSCTVLTSEAEIT